MRVGQESEPPASPKEAPLCKRLAQLAAYYYDHGSYYYETLGKPQTLYQVYSGHRV